MLYGKRSLRSLPENIETNMLFPTIQAHVVGLPQFEQAEVKTPLQLTGRLVKVLRKALEDTSVRAERTGPNHFRVGETCFRVTEEYAPVRGSNGEALCRWFAVHVQRRSKWVVLCKGGQRNERIAPEAIH